MKPLSVVMMLLLSVGSAGVEDSHGAATSMPGGMTPPMVAVGSIAVKVVQGTKGGPKIGPDEVIVELYGHGGILHTSETKLDVHGVTVIENLPLVAPFRPRVTVKHGGTSYSQDGEVMHADNPTQDITITVFETSDKDPQWEVAMWSLVLNPLEKGGAEVVETLVARNPSDAAYLGSPDADGCRISVALTLPKEAKNVTMEGDLHASYASVVGNRVLSRAPLKPGTSHFRLHYTIPTPGGTAEVDLVAPAGAGRLMVFVPMGYEGFRSDILKPSKVGTIENHRVQPYAAVDISAGQKISFTLDGLPGPVVKTSYIPQMFAALGGVILVILCVVVILTRGPEAEIEADAI